MAFDLERAWDEDARAFLARFVDARRLEFFAGSVTFTYDSFVSAPHQSVIGYVFFVGGRLAFLWGSTTDEVNWLLQRTPGTRKRGPTL